MLTGAIIGLVVALTLTVLNRRRARQGSGLPGKIEETLRGRGALTLKEIASLVGKDSFLGRGEVSQALAALTGVGKVRAIPVPDGTPLLKRADLIKYEVTDRVGPA